MLRCRNTAFIAGITVLSFGLTDVEAQPADAGAVRALLKEVRKIERAVHRLRRLSAAPLRKAAVPVARLRLVMQRALARQYPPERVAAEEAALKRLGLMPQATSLQKELSALGQASGAVAYYDPRTRKLHVLDSARPSEHGAALAKEVCHAQQDRRFRIRRYLTPIKHDRDRTLARRALVGGDCAAVMLAYSLAPAKRNLRSLSGDFARLLRQRALHPDSGWLKDAPPLLREAALFPAVSGLLFVQRVRVRHPWGVVNRLYSRPPRTTEQVLHPRKYWRRERPVRVTARKLPSLADRKLVTRDVLGELVLSVYLRQGLSEAAARRAAEGWGGDTLVVYGARSAERGARNGKQGTAHGAQGAGSGPVELVHLTTWDSEADALEFANAQRHVLLARKMKAAGTTGNVWTFTEGPTSQWSVQLFDRHVLLLGGFAPELRQKLQTEVWEHWRIRGRRVRPR